MALLERRRWCTCVVTLNGSNRAGSATQKSPRPLQGDLDCGNRVPSVVAELLLQARVVFSRQCMLLEEERVSCLWRVGSIELL